MRTPLPRLTFALIPFLFACHGNGTGDLPQSTNGPKTLGAYQGSFGNGIITIVLNYINGDIVSGYEIHKAARRNLNGSVKADGAYLDFKLKEPGDFPMDGTFTLRLDTASSAIQGSWKPLHADVADREVKLQKTNPGASDQNESWYYNVDNWEGAGGQDTILFFGEDGACTYSFYTNSRDSTSQKNVVKGSYIKDGRTFRIDWQKNPYTPAQQMNLVIKVRAAEGGGQGDSTATLEGNGWILEPFQGG